MVALAVWLGRDALAETRRAPASVADWMLGYARSHGCDPACVAVAGVSIATRTKTGAVIRTALRRSEPTQKYVVSGCDYGAFFVCTKAVDNFVKKASRDRLTAGGERVFVKLPKH